MSGAAVPNAKPEIVPELVAELEARRLLVTVEDHGTAKVLVLTCDDQQVTISSEPGQLTTAAGGFEELAMEALQIAGLLRARAEREHGVPPHDFSGERVL